MNQVADNILDKFTLLPSIAGLMINSDKDLKIVSSGVKALNKPNKVDNTTTYIIGSCSKSMTAAMIMKACIVKGIANPMKTITIGSVIPSVQHAYKDVTLKQLLCMSSGIVDIAPPNGVVSFDFWKYFITSTDDLRTQRAQLTQKVCGVGVVGPAFPPGTAYYYSNLGYVIAAHIIEVKFNSTYEEMMKKYLLIPLHMKMKFAMVPPVYSTADAVGHSIMGEGMSQYDAWLVWWNFYLKKAKPKLSLAPQVNVNNAIGFIVDTELQYPPPVMYPAGLVRLDMESWARYLYAVMTHSKHFLPEWAWKTLLNTGVEEKQWAPGGKITDIGQKYSFGWLYTPSNPGFLFYTGATKTFTADIILKQHDVVLATVTNSGRSSNDTLPLHLLEKALCPSKNIKVLSILNAIIDQRNKNPPMDPWVEKNTSIESFSTLTSSAPIDDAINSIPLLFIILLCILLKRKVINR